MTIFTVRLQTDNDETKHGAYLIYGEIAQACESLTGLKLVEIADDVATSSEPSISAKPRKPRGKNKTKVLPTEPSPPVVVPEQLDIEHPQFLKRT